MSRGSTKNQTFVSCVFLEGLFRLKRILARETFCCTMSDVLNSISRQDFDFKTYSGHVLTCDGVIDVADKLKQSRAKRQPDRGWSLIGAQS